MKILMVTSDLSDAGGVNRVIANLAEIFSGIPELQVDILHAKAFKGIRYPMPLGITLIQGVQLLKGSNAVNLLLNLLRLRRGKYEYVLSFWTQENIVTSLAFLGSRSKRILSEHFCYDQSSPLVARLRKWLYRTANKVLVLNNNELLYYRSICANATLVPNPVVKSSIDTIDHSAKQNLIIGVGHLIKRKGFEYLIEASARAGIASAGWRVAIIGEGPEHGNLVDLIEKFNASAYIQLVPATTSIEDWYRLAKVIVVPSISEVFSMVIPEAMAHGVIPVAFAADGPKEILQDHPHQLVPVNDVNGLAAALTRTIGDSRLAQEAVTFREEALARYSYSAIAKRWEGLLGLTYSPRNSG